MYSDLIDVLCSYTNWQGRVESSENDGDDNLMWTPPLGTNKASGVDAHTEQLRELDLLFDGSNDKDIEEDRDAVTFAVPMFQAPTGFFCSYRKDGLLLFP